MFSILFRNRHSAMSPRPDNLPTSIPSSPVFLAHHGIDWSRVRRMRYTCYQRFLYTYPGPVRNLHQKLMVVPLDRYVDQVLCEQHLAIAPHPADVLHDVDEFGNRVCKLDIAYIDRAIAFEAMISVERRAQPERRQQVAADDVKRYLPATHLTASDRRIAAIARELAAQSADQRELAEKISDWVANALAYGSGATGVTTTAAQALKVGKGLCQDYAHLMLAICRAINLPARYVSGHMVAEGGSHAWVEVLLPSAEPGKWEAIAFDPTNRRQPNLGYTTIAVGRDYRDVSPSSGHYSAPYTGLLSFMKRAGLTLLEYNDGELIDCEGGSQSSSAGLQPSH